MSKIKIVCDSSCDMPRHYEKELNIGICPLGVTIDGTTYREWYDLMPEEFYKLLVSAKDFPKTTLAGPELFLEQYKNAEKEGFDSVIVITLPASASGTFQSANIAKEMYEDEGGTCRIVTFDSQLLSYPYGYLVVNAAQMAAEGKSVEEILEKTEYIRRHYDIYFAVDSLEYLKKGGRINSAKAAIGTFLDLKPILSLKGGLVEQVDMVRGSKRILPRIIQLLKSHKGNADFERVVIGTAANPELSDKYKAKLTEEFGCTEFEDFNVGVVVGAHAGPGFSAVFVINPEFENDCIN